MQSDKKTPITLTVLGCRGSMAVSGPTFAKYGGATSSYLYMTDTEAIILDAGTGILNLPDLGDRRVSLLITHSHIDHILGLPCFIPTLGAKEISIYGATNAGLTIRQQLDTYLRKPLWPVGLDIFPAKKNFVEVKEDGVPFDIGPVKVSAVPANHPGGSTIFKLECEGTSVVYATDFEHEELPEDRKPERTEDADKGEAIQRYYTQPMEALSSFAKGADLCIFDGQFTPQEYVKCKTFGHSTYEKGIELMDMAGIKKMLLVHHAPGHTDEFIDSMIKELPAGKAIEFAKESDVYDIIK
jgi:ribonuclease BN (tRNA processing enzyme)